MLKKLVIASATAAVAAGLGLATPAHAQDLVEITCTGPDFGDRNYTAEPGDLLVGGALLGAGILNEVAHNQSSRQFTYTCGDGAIRNVGNTTVQKGGSVGLLNGLG
jgi:hypothetical protein